MEFTIKIEDKQVYKTLLQFLESLHIQVIEKKYISEDIDSERLITSKQNLSKAYSDKEPDYSTNMIKELNPTYERR